MDPSAYSPPYDRSLCAALARSGADVELVTSRFLYGPLEDFEKPLIEAEGKLEELFADAGGRFVSLEEVAKLRRKIRRQRHDRQGDDPADGRAGVQRTEGGGRWK